MTQTARVYGSSMYELAAEEQLTEKVYEEMNAIRTLFNENPDYMHLLKEPIISKEERIKLIDEAFGSQAEPYLVNFLKLLCERGILGEYAGCCDEYKRRYNADHNICEAVVTSALPLNEKQKEDLKARLEKVSGRKIDLICKVDTSVVAGLRVELEGKQLDGTVSGRLDTLSRSMEKTLL